MTFTDRQAIEIVAVMMRAKVLDKDQQHRAEALLRESLRERFGPLLEEKKPEQTLSIA